jgi:hypothetical protein
MPYVLRTVWLQSGLLVRVQIAAEVRAFFGMTPKQYRKVIGGNDTVVETQMCAGDWDNINFSHVPSVAARNYKKAFNRHTPAFAEYVAKLVAGDKTVKVNASAIFPHDVLKGSAHSYTKLNKTETDHVIAQWDALPNYVGDASILPLVDVSGSMTTSVPGRTLFVAWTLQLVWACTWQTRTRVCSRTHS